MLYELKNNTKQYLKSMIFSFKNNSKINFDLADRYQKNTENKNYLVKRSMVEKYIYKTLKSNFKWMQYLKYEELKNLKKNLIFEMKLFINNNLFSSNYSNNKFSIYRISQEIKNNFNLNLESYISSSKKNVDLFKENILENKIKIEKAKSNIYKVKDSVSFSLMFKNLLTKIERSKGISQFRINQIKNNYIDEVLKEKNKLKDYDLIIKKYKWITKQVKMFLFGENYYKNGINKKTYIHDFYLKEANNEFLLMKDILSSFNFLLKDFDVLRKIVINRKHIDKNDIKKYLLILRFIDIFEESLIPTENLLKPFTEIDFINRNKLNLIKTLVKKPLLIVIEDDIRNNDLVDKHEFIKILNNLNKFNNSAFVFITNKKDILEKNKFDYVYIFNNNKESESGTYENIYKNIINKSYSEKFDIDNEENYSLYDEFKIHNDHYIISSFKYYKKVLNEAENTQKLQDDTEALQNELKTKIENVVSPLLGLEEEIININNNDSIYSSNRLNEEYIEYFNENKININEEEIQTKEEAY